MISILTLIHPALGISQQTSNLLGSFLGRPKTNLEPSECKINKPSILLFIDPFCKQFSSLIEQTINITFGNQNQRIMKANLITSKPYNINSNKHRSPLKVNNFKINMTNMVYTYENLRKNKNKSYVKLLVTLPSRPTILLSLFSQNFSPN